MKMKIQFYTFRTCRFRDKISDAFVFGKLKYDFAIFSEKILKEKPELIVGIANGSRLSCFESKAVNRFNNVKKVSKDGKDSFDLHVLEKLDFIVSNKTTDSFCNWTAYKTMELLKENGLDTKLVFIHLAEKDLPYFLQNVY